MAALSKNRFWRKARYLFRGFRVGILFGLFLIVAALTYLNLIGLPDFLKRPLLGKLRQKGLEVKFTGIHLRGIQSIVFENAQFTRTNQLLPRFSAGESELALDLSALAQSKLKWNSLLMQKGELLWPLSKTNAEFLTFNKVNAEMNFPGGDQVEVKRFSARFQNAPLEISGTITNFSALQKVKLPKSPKKKKPGSLSELEQFAAIWKKIEFASPPELILKINGDAGDLETMQGQLKLSASGAETPWGKFINLNLVADLDQKEAGSPLRLRVGVDSARTTWASGENIDLSVKVTSLNPGKNPIEAKINLAAQQFRTSWSSGTNNHQFQAAQFTWKGTSAHWLTNFIPVTASGNLDAARPQLTLGLSNIFSAESAQWKIALGHQTTDAESRPDSSWGWWQKVEPYTLEWEGSFQQIKVPQLEARKILSSGEWRAPNVVLKKIEGELYGGRFEANGELNVVSRLAHVKNISDFDVQKITPLLNRSAQRFVQKYAWENPPRLRGEAHVILPPWTNSTPDWNAILDSLKLDGDVAVGRGSYRKISFETASTHLGYSNRIWNLPEIHIVRPEGEAKLSLVSNERTRDFHWRIQSGIDPRAIRDQLTEKQQQGFDYLQFTTPPIIDAEVAGNWSDDRRLGLKAKIAVTNFSYRGTSVDALTAIVDYTNLFLKLSEGRLQRADKQITGQVDVDFSQDKVIFKNIDSTMDPMLVTRAIGRKVAAAIEPYQFAEPPAVQLNGSLIVGDIEKADMHFVVKGDAFKWGIFRADKISGNVDWTGETLSLTNIQSSAYKGGQIMGWGWVDFRPKGKTDYRLDAAFADVDAQAVVASLDKTNSIEGILHGRLELTSANTKSFESWNGSGKINFRDGLIWEIPVFGIFSPMLNAILPGTGTSRAKEASGTFSITNGVAFSDDMEIRASNVRLEYRGTLDFEQKVDARVKAEILRDAWGVGRFVSWALTPLSSLFEFSVSGKISNPKTEPVYIPKFLMSVLRPFHSMKKLFPEKDETPGPPESTIGNDKSTGR